MIRVNSWPDAHVERLRTLWREGLSCRLLALALNDSFGSTYTRNAVIGKARRLRLPRRAHAASKPGMMRVTREPRAQSRIFGPTRVKPAFIIVGSGGVIEKPPGHEPRLRVSADAFVPLFGSTPLPWTERAFGQCAWPVDGGEGEQLSCALPCDPEIYCTAHLARRSDRSKKPSSANDLMRALRRYAA